MVFNPNYQEPTKLLQDLPRFFFAESTRKRVGQKKAAVKTLDFKGKPCVGTILMKADKA